MKFPPNTIFLVQRIPPDDEPKKYYSVSKTRIYYSAGHVKQFLEANENSSFKIWKTSHLLWEEMTVEDFK